MELPTEALRGRCGKTSAAFLIPRIPTSRIKVIRLAQALIQKQVLHDCVQPKSTKNGLALQDNHLRYAESHVRTLYTWLSDEWHWALILDDTPFCGEASETSTH